MRAAGILYILCMSVAIQMSGQSYLTPVKSDLTPPTPQSAAPVEYQMPQPAMLTGTIHLNIPLYTVTAGDYSLPLSMCYHTSGIKVFDDPCPYGYGWVLQPALRATRTILGRPDEHFEFSNLPGNPHHEQEWAYQCMVNQFSVSIEFPERYDSQHDLITLSLPDRNLTRVLDCSSGHPEFVSGLDDEYSVSADDRLDEICVTGPLGEKYIFGAPYEAQPSDVYPGGQLRTAWALREIISSDGKHIRLTWTTRQHTYAHHNILGGVSLTDRFDAGNAPLAQTEHIHDDYEDTSFTHIGDCHDFITLTAIDFPGGSVLFSYLTHDQSPLLSKVEISNSSRTVKTVEFGYTIPYHGCVFLSRLTLDGEGTYAMEYARQVDFQNKPNSQDWWGYFNGRDNPSLTPALRLYTWPSKMSPVAVYTPLLGQADRSVDPEAMKANMLTSVTYPTGGRVSFEYEPHKFTPVRAEEGSGEIHSDYNPYLEQGGGLRIRSVELSSGDNAPVQRITYSYCPAKVREVPSVASFIDVVQGAFPLVGIPGTSQTADIVRHVNVKPVPDYMRYDYGETPLWYPTVTADYAEGRVVFNYKDLVRQNDIIRQFGIRRHRDIHKAFSQGPQLVSKVTYKYESGQYVAVQKDSMEYVVDCGRESESMFISRNVVMLMNYGDFAPDLHEARKVPWCVSGYTYILPDEYAPYWMYRYRIIPRTERLSKKISTVYTDNGAFTTEQSYTCKPGTGLLSTAESTGSDGFARTVAVEYPDAASGGVQSQMVLAGATGVPIRETVLRSGARTVYEAEFTQSASGGFRVKRTSVAFDNSADRLLSPLYSYLDGGQLCSATDADGISSAWLWGYGGLYPVYGLSGHTYSEVIAAEGSGAASLSAEGLELDGAAAYHATLYNWEPLVGVTAVNPAGRAPTLYSYDTGGRLVKVQTGMPSQLRTLQAYTYQTGHDVENYVEASELIDDGSGLRHTVRTTYDGLGRSVATEDLATGISFRTEYDNMGRAARVSVPGADSPGIYDWTVTTFEPSPRCVATAAMRPGELWHKQQLRATTRTLTNTVSGDYSCPRYIVTPEGIVRAGMYAAGTLLIYENTDEDGHIVRTFTDKDGLAVMTSEGRRGDWLRTRYVRDPHGRLRFVLPPNMDDGDYSLNSSELTVRAFACTYDSRGRCISVRTPGCSPSLTRYSRGGRVVAERTPAMTDNEWIVHLYDRHGRDVMQVLVPLSEAEVSAICDNLPVAHYDGGNSFGGYAFSHEPWAATKTCSIIRISYFDDYAFLDSAPSTLRVASMCRPQPGLPTGERDYMSHGFSAYYYDEEGREVSRRTIRTGQQCIDRSFDERGLLVSETESFISKTARAFERTTRWTYDMAGRQLSCTVHENGSTASTALTYDKYGRVASETLGNGVTRHHSYDIHDWLTATTTQLPVKLLTVNPGITPPGRHTMPGLYYDKLVPDSLVMREAKLAGSYTDRLYYADGAVEPRYTGCPTARINTLGGRYDYRFDAHDRLIAADYTPGKGASVDEDFSTVYKYDAVANPLMVLRHGVVSTEAGGSEEFGVLDKLMFAYNGNQLESVANDSEGENFYGRTGYGATATGGSYRWNAQGFMTSDTSRGITNIKYNFQGLPTSITFGLTKFESNTYDASGQLITSSYKNARGIILNRRDYEAGRMFVNDRPAYSYFPGGYFDGEGAPHYLHTDYQGSVVMVTDSTGNIEQHNSYYPYGEPHRLPQGQPQLYTSKERIASTGEYNYGARRHYAPSLNWTTPDPKAPDYNWLSPYSFCAANPISIREVDGKEWQVVYDDNNKAYNIEWVDPKKAYDENGKLLPNHYVIAIMFSPEGAKIEYDSKNKYNIGSSLCTVYLADGETKEYDACTYPSDTSKYSMIPEGQYEAQVGKHKQSYDALRVADVGTTDFGFNKITLDEPNKAHPTVNYMLGTNIHKAGFDNCTGMTSSGKAISEGCLLIDRTKWDNFISNFTKNITVGIILKR